MAKYLIIESPNSTTAMHIIDAALRKGHNVNS